MAWKEKSPKVINAKKYGIKRQNNLITTVKNLNIPPKWKL